MNRLKKLSGKFTENTLVLLKNSTGALVVKGLGMLISMVSVPAYLDYFGDNTVLGVWYTILSVITWIDFFDLGIGNGLRNSLVKCFAQGNQVRARELISSAYVIIGLLTAVLMVAGNALIGLVDWNALLNVSEEMLSASVLLQAVRRIYLGVVLHFFLKLISSVIYAMQKSALNNLISLLGNALRLAFVLLAPRSDPEANLTAISQAYAFFSCSPYLIASVVIFFTKLRRISPSLRFCRKDAVSEVMSIGGVFFLCQILYMLLINTNDFCITFFTGPENTTEYNIYFKLFSAVGTLAQLALTPVWSVVTKAIYEKSYSWLRGLYSRTIKIIGLVTFVQLLMTMCLQVLVNIWLGDDAIEVHFGYALVFAVWGTMFTLQNTLSTFVCGMGKLKLQVIFYSLGVVLKFTLLFLIYQVADQWIWVVVVNILVMAPYCIVQHRQLVAYFNNLEDKDV